MRTGFLLWIAVAFYLLCAYKCSGYLHEDEHYQLVEFANYKLGTVPYNGLAWEFREMVRPGFQPFICYIIFKTLKYFGITDGYTLIFILRVLTGLLSIFVINSFVAVHKKYVTPSWRNIYIAASYFLWFLPYINMRFSSENLSGLMLVYSMVLLNRSNICRNTKLTILTGAVLGLSVLFRFQSLLIILGIMIWLLWVRKAKLTAILLVKERFLNILRSKLQVYGARVTYYNNYPNANMSTKSYSKTIGACDCDDW